MVINCVEWLGVLGDGIKVLFLALALGMFQLFLAINVADGGARLVYFYVDVFTWGNFIFGVDLD